MSDVTKPESTEPRSTTIEARVIEPELRTAEDGSLTFTGYATVFDRLSVNLGGFQERILRNAFSDVLDTHPDVRFLINHNTDLVLARTASGTMELSQDFRGLRVYAKLDPRQSYVNDLAIAMRRGDIDAMSFMLVVAPEDERWSEKDGVQIREVVRVSALPEVSVVPFPAYPATAGASLRSQTVIQGRDLYDRETGDVAEAEVRSFAAQIYAGEVEATAAERAAIDGAFSRMGDVSPWVAAQMEARSAEAASDEPTEDVQADELPETEAVTAEASEPVEAESAPEARSVLALYERKLALSSRGL